MEEVKRSPSFSALKDPRKPVLRIVPKETTEESRVTTKQPSPSTPSPRGHA